VYYTFVFGIFQGIDGAFLFCYFDNLILCHGREKMFLFLGPCPKFPTEEKQ